MIQNYWREAAAIGVVALMAVIIHLMLPPTPSKEVAEKYKVVGLTTAWTVEGRNVVGTTKHLLKSTDGFTAEVTESQWSVVKEGQQFKTRLWRR